MSRTIRLTLLVFTLASIFPPAGRAAWQESGYIGSCAGRGCLGQRHLCSVYTWPAANGGTNTFYCYLNP